MILDIPVTKGKASIQIDTGAVNDDVLKEIYIQGLKVLLNRGASKVTKSAHPDPEAMKAKAMEVAATQLDMILKGTIKFTGGKAKKASGAVMTEARRIAKGLVKDALRDNGLKISHYEAKEITRLANELIEADPEIIKLAESNLAERSKKPIAIDVKSMIHASPKLVAKADEKKAKAKKKGADDGPPLSAAQAGKLQHRARPTVN